MKSYFALFLAFFLVSVAFAGDEETNDKVKKAFEKCKEQHPVTEAEIAMVKNKEDVPDSKNAKCLMACMLEEGKILRDGKYSKDNALVMADVLHKDDAEQAEKARKIVELCATEVGTEVGGDSCEFAYKMAVCGNNHAKELGVKRPDF